MAPRPGRGDWQGSGKGGEERGGGAGGRGDRKGGGGGGGGGGKSGKGKGGGGGGGGGQRDENREDGDRHAGGPRSTLSSTAPDFTPVGGYGGYGFEDSTPGGYWAWQSLTAAQPLPLWREYADPDGVAYYYNSKTGLTQWDRPMELDPPKPSLPPPAEPEIPMSAMQQRERQDRGARDPDRRRSGGGRDGDDSRRREEGGAGRGERGGGRGGAGGGGGDRDRGGAGGGDRGRRRGGGGADKKQDAGDFGPPGCNLFVFHLPDDWTDDDLHEYFAPHGSVVSAKVMKELGTGRSRGFGFVSYEDRVGAATAIKKMQGYKILGKRLKVEFKKGEADSNKEMGDDGGEDDEGMPTGGKKYPDDERLIGYLRAISAKNVVQSLKEAEGSSGPGGGGDFTRGLLDDDDDD